MPKLPVAHEGDKPNPRDKWPEWSQDLAYWIPEDELNEPADTEPTGPTDADAEWAAENLNQDDGHADEPTPDDVYDRRAEESAIMDRLEGGYQ